MTTPNPENIVVFDPKLHIKTWHKCQKKGCLNPVEILCDYKGLPGWAKYYCCVSHAFQDQ